MWSRDVRHQCRTTYTTTVVGAHSVPRWYEALDLFVALGQLAEGDFADAQLRATQASILEQQIAGIDVITGGEMHRRRHNRHAPPNAMLFFFWQKIPSFQGDCVARGFAAMAAAAT
jgi:5-methyltetrahydropteroyltriglutamate--homocysteine methyltransferase